VVGVWPHGGPAGLIGVTASAAQVRLCRASCERRAPDIDPDLTSAVLGFNLHFNILTRDALSAWVDSKKEQTTWRTGNGMQKLRVQDS